MYFIFKCFVNSLRYPKFGWLSIHERKRESCIISRQTKSRHINVAENGFIILKNISVEQFAVDKN